MTPSTYLMAKVNSMKTSVLPYFYLNNIDFNISPNW